MLPATVLCIHSFASSWRQFRGLVPRLAGSLRVVAPCLFGHGNCPAWPWKRPFLLADEAAALERALPPAAPLHLVGHSYGGAVALHLAGRLRWRVRSLVLYEPAIWGTLAALRPGEAGTREIEAIRDDTLRLIGAGEVEAASERFIDYWAGPGAWAATPMERRAKLVESVRSLHHAWHATFSERWTLDGLRALDVPCLLLTGTRSTAAARLGVRILRESLPRVRVLELPHLDHLGPMTQPQLVDPAIEAFLVHGREPVPQTA